MTTKPLTLAAIIALTLAATASSALAHSTRAPSYSGAEAYATATVNVRSGPSTGYRVVDVLRPGEAVQIRSCSGNWCHVVKSGPDGWVSKSYLGTSAKKSPRRAPKVNFSIEFGFGKDRGRFDRGEVCFYEHFNYKGDSFCVDSGEEANWVGDGWNDRISSIKVKGGAAVRVYQHASYEGASATVRRSVPQLNNFNDAISSYRVR
ncbi:MAG TPA: SH3 domain-containing protein [Devosiaceae bacterium]|jgi:hypothetical protein|nr:SH3 domain-containing protein [Devosiaceae bacterium]